MATKKTAAKKAPAKKVASKKTTPSRAKTTRTRVSKAEELQSFKLTKSSTPFLTIAITRQTLYWSIIALAVFILGLWTIHLQNKVNEIYDEIEVNQQLLNSTPDPVAKPKHAEPAPATE